MSPTCGKDGRGGRGPALPVGKAGGHRPPSAGWHRTDPGPRKEGGEGRALLLDFPSQEGRRAASTPTPGAN